MIDRADSDIVELAGELIGFESENPPGAERECAEFIADWFTANDIDAELVASPEPDRPSVAARIGSGAPTLVLNGHTDVVPVDEPDDWSVEPYEGTIDGDRLYGRGSADMKTGVALAMVLARDLAPIIEDDGTAGSLVVHAVAGEETGYPGAEAVLEAGYEGDMGIVLEPTHLRVATRAKGVSTFRLIIEGESSHASRPDQGHNPIDDLQRLLTEVHEYDADLRSRSDPLCGQAFATVTQVDAGVDQNMAVIPGRAEVLMDRRVLPEETYEDVEAEVHELIETLRAEGMRIERELVQHYDSSIVESDCPVAQVVSSHANDIAGTATDPIGLEAATDARALVSAGIETIIWGPGSLEQAHTVDEWISLGEVKFARSILEQSIRELLNLDSDG